LSPRKSIAFGAGDIAESADNDVRQAYNAALAAAAKALFELAAPLGNE
jgi:hypothetical protein